MNKNKIISIFIGVLLISNLLLIAFIFLNKSKGFRRHEGPRDIIIERLNFNKKQIADYDVLIEGHKKAIRQNDEAILALKDQLYLNLSKDEKVLINDSLANEIGKLQTQVEYLNYHHFEDIKKLCHKEQLTNFNALMKDIAKLFSRHKGNRPPK